MGCSHVADHTPKGISSAEYTTCLYSEARKAREAPSRGAHCSGPSPSTECLSSSVCHLRAGFSALLVRQTARKRRPPCAGDSLREDRGCKIEWVLEADLKNFFGSLSHEWMLRLVEHRVGDQRLISLIRRWLKAGVFENEERRPNEQGTPQGGSISVLLSNLYL